MLRASKVGLALALGKAVEGNRRLDLVGAAGGEQERKHAAHAEPDDTDRVAGDGFVSGEVVDRSTHVAGGAVGG